MCRGAIRVQYQCVNVTLQCGAMMQCGDVREAGLLATMMMDGSMLTGETYVGEG